MVAVYLILYSIGSVFVFLGARSVVRNSLESSPLDVLPVLALGVGLVGIAAVLHTVVIRRVGELESSDDEPGFPLPPFTLAVLAFIVPMIVSWVQFELHMNPVYFFPWLTVFGAMTSVWLASRWMTRKGLYSNAFSAVAVALFGLPFGAAAVEVLNSHFQYHMTDLRVMFYNHDTEQMDTHDLLANQPALHPQAPLLGKETAEIFRTLSDAQPVDIWQEIEEGRAKVGPRETILWLRNGEWVATEPLNELEMDAALYKASANDTEEHAKKEAARRAAFEHEVDLRRRGGRLFSKP